jgi:uncharacterized lipoprotein YmbA
MKRAMLFLVATLAFAGCSTPTVPDVTYFRLPPPTPLEHAAKQLSSLPIEVDVFSGEGVYAEEALIYTASPDAGSVRAYHYQLWGDPPTHALQTRLTGLLRDSGIAPLVTDRLPASVQALRVHGTIKRYDRIKREQGYTVAVAFEMRVEQDNGEPLLEQNYAVEVPATDATIDATVHAFGTAVDQVFAKFYVDLVGLAGNAG